MQPAGGLPVSWCNATHFEPAGPQPGYALGGRHRLNPYVAQFFLCHLGGDQSACDLIEDVQNPSSLCNAYNEPGAFAPPRGECETVTAAPPTSPVVWHPRRRCPRSGRRRCLGYYAEIYPSLMDPASPSPNFDVVGEFPYIYFMTFHNSVASPSGGSTVVRSIQRRPLRMSGAGG
jgi:hypothetical protein